MLRVLICLFIYIPRHWTEVHGRAPASVLTCLLKHYHPGLVKYRGKIVVASTWKHYQAAKDTSGKSMADVVDEGFWVIIFFACVCPFSSYGGCDHNSLLDVTYRDLSFSIKFLCSFSLLVLLLTTNKFAAKV